MKITIHSTMIAAICWLILVAQAQCASASEATVAVPVANVFRKPTISSERVTQALLGDRVVIVATRDGWAQVLLPDQYRLAEGYPGWMQRTDLGSVPPSTPHVMVRVPRAWIRRAPNDTAPVVGSPFRGSRLAREDGRIKGWLQVAMPDGGAGWIRARDVAADGPLPVNARDIIVTALQLRGTRYLWGGLSAAGIDCSGLVYTTFRLYGIQLPRDADQQALVGVPVDKAALQAGDLVFFGKNGSLITHVGIYMDSGRFVEAASRTGVTISRLASRGNAYRGARRVIGVKLTMPSPSP